MDVPIHTTGLPSSTSGFTIATGDKIKYKVLVEPLFITHKAVIHTFQKYITEIHTTPLNRQ